MCKINLSMHFTMNYFGHNKNFKLNVFLKFCLILKKYYWKIIYLSWNPDIALLCMSCNFYRKMFIVILQNLMRMELFAIDVLKLI